MTCDNCRHLKITNFRYEQLASKWNDIYHPMNITDGYKNRYLKEANKLGMPPGDTKLRFIYCENGLLTRFYIVRGSKSINAKASVGQCSSYK